MTAKVKDNKADSARERDEKPVFLLPCHLLFYPICLASNTIFVDCESNLDSSYITYLGIVDLTLIHLMSHTLTYLADKILTSTPHLLVIADFLLVLTYTLCSAVANWFLGGSSSSQD
ncbi:hypothetical protein ACA910_001549 [Epithemia clementina (nom. ined.)]